MAWPLATAMHAGDGSMPVTAKPRRAKGSDSSPPPQPMSSKERPENGEMALGARVKCDIDVWRIKPRRTGLNLCSGANLPAGFHHSAASAVNLATSEGSSEAAWAVACSIKPLLPCPTLGLHRAYLTLVPDGRLRRRNSPFMYGSGSAAWTLN